MKDKRIAELKAELRRVYREFAAMKSELGRLLDLQVEGKVTDREVDRCGEDTSILLDELEEIKAEIKTLTAA